MMMMMMMRPSQKYNYVTYLCVERSILLMLNGITKDMSEASMDTKETMHELFSQCVHH